MDIDPNKALAALEQLEAEKERRLQAKIDAGEAVSIIATVLEGESIEQAKARALASHVSDGRAVHFELWHVNTGVPRAPDSCSPSAWAGAPPSRYEEPVASGEYHQVASEEFKAPSQPEAYVRIQVRPSSDDGDPGEIAEAWFSVDDGHVALRDSKHRHITSRALMEGQNPADIARQLLHEARQPAGFNRRLDYPKLGAA
jgi:hypothetical protein